MKKIDKDSLEAIRRQLEAAGGDECVAGAEKISNFLNAHHDGFTEEQGYQVLHSVWGWVSMALDRSSAKADCEPGLNDLEAHLAAAVGEYRKAGGVV